ncbi:MAG: glycosyltransferase family 2 protein [Ignavibacteria bacterium]|nr:glycosyltransferase family 2 protein [Ignavibacteria bacterium]
MVSIIIISYNTQELTLNCIDSLYRTYPEGEVIVVDNRSPDKTVEMIHRTYPDVRVIVTPENKSYANAVNLGMNATTSEFSIVCNADVEFNEHSVERLIHFLRDNPTVGVCSPQQEYIDGSWQYCFGPTPSIIQVLFDIIILYGIINAVKSWFYPRFKKYDWPRSVGYCDGAVLAIRRHAFEEINGFDEAFAFYSEEADFCYRLTKQGWGVYFQPKATVMHIRGASSGNEMNMSENAVRKLVNSKVQFIRKHYTEQQVKLFISLEIFNYRFKELLCNVLLRMKSTNLLQSKYRMFHMLVQFYREIR